MSLKTQLAKIGMSDLVYDVGRLVSGTLGGRIIALAAMPFVTRLYSPADFALLAVYLGLVGMISVMACLRFDIAIPVAEDDSDAVHLLVLALGFASGIALLGLLLVLALPQELAEIVGQPALAPWLWLAPLGVLVASFYSALQFWATRMRRFGSIAVTRVTQAAAGASTMLALGWAGIAPLGLLLGNMLNIGAGSLRLGLDLFRFDRLALRQVNPAGLRRAFRRYSRYPIYSTPESLANMAGMQVPVLIVAAHAGAEAGFLLLAQQVMAAPMALLGSSIAQVYISRAPEALREGRLASFTADVLRRLMQIGVVPLILVGLAAPLIFPWIFGSGWERAGLIVAWMVPWIVLQFIASPVSMALHATGRQHWAMMLQLVGLVLRIIPILLAASLWGGGHLIALIVGATLFYALYLVVVMLAVGLRLTGRTGCEVSGVMLLLVSYIVVLWWI